MCFRFQQHARMNTHVSVWYRSPCKQKTENKNCFFFSFFFFCFNKCTCMYSGMYCHGQIEHEQVRANWNAFSRFRFCHFDVGTISACTASLEPTPPSATRYTAARNRTLSRVITCESCSTLYFPASVSYVHDSATKKKGN